MSDLRGRGRPRAADLLRPDQKRYHYTNPRQSFRHRCLECQDHGYSVAVRRMKVETHRARGGALPKNAAEPCRWLGLWFHGLEIKSSPVASQAPLLAIHAPPWCGGSSDVNRSTGSAVGNHVPYTLRRALLTVTPRHTSFLTAKVGIADEMETTAAASSRID